MRRDMAAAAIILGLVILPAIVTIGSKPDHAQYGGVLMIGPIPIIFSSSPQMALISMVSAIALMAISFLFMRRLTHPPAPYPEWQDGCSGYADISKEGPKDDGNKNKGIGIKGGSVIMIGPIPIIVGSDPRTALILMLLTLSLMLIWLLFTLGH